MPSSILVHTQIDPSASLSIRRAAFPGIRSHCKFQLLWYEFKIFKGSSPLSANEMHGKQFVNHRVFYINRMSTVFHIFHSSVYFEN